MTMPAILEPEDHRTWWDFSRVHPRRGLILTGLGAVAGLVIAGVSLFTAKGTSTLVVPADAVALVNQRPISRIDYLGVFQVLGEDPRTVSPARKRKVLDDMIREELFVQRAAELDVASVDGDVRAAMVAAVEQQTAASALATRPSDAELRRWYDLHKANYASEGRMVLRDLVFSGHQKAEAAVELLRRGVPVDQVVARFGGRDTERVKGEEFYFAAQIHLGEDLFEQARNLPGGGLSGPVVQSDGVHLLAMIRNQRPVAVDFADARPQVLNDLMRDAVTRLEVADARFLRKRANILIAKDLRP